MPGAAQSFLQGLLMKDPRQRLSWPELLGHPFLAGHVTSEYLPRCHRYLPPLPWDCGPKPLQGLPVFQALPPPPLTA